MWAIILWIIGIGVFVIGLLLTEYVFDNFGELVSFAGLIICIVALSLTLACGVYALSDFGESDFDQMNDYIWQIDILNENIQSSVDQSKVSDIISSYEATKNNLNILIIIWGDKENNARLETYPTYISNPDGFGYVKTYN